MRSPSEAMRPMWPFLAFFVMFMFWSHNSPNNIIDKDPRMVFILTGTIFSNISVSNYLIFYALTVLE